MTVISAVITRYGVAHASDSLIVRPLDDGSYEPLESEQSKIVPIDAWRGAMAYWGLAIADDYSTYDWLKKQAATAGQYPCAEEFARDLKAKLNQVISKMRFRRRIDSGIGIHLTVYEYIEGHWVPELFRISNYTDTLYNSVYPDGLRLSRETYHTVAKVDQAPEHGEKGYRLKVHRYLHGQPPGVLIYNNGDPVLDIIPIRLRKSHSATGGSSSGSCATRSRFPSPGLESQLSSCAACP